MAGEATWRSSDYGERFKHHDHADFAQEFLRRNPDYVRDYDDTQRRAGDAPHRAQEEKEGLARRWGLSFPLRARQLAEGYARALVTRRVRFDDHLQWPSRNSRVPGWT